MKNEGGKSLEPLTETRDYPFSEDFEGEAFPPEGWTIYSQLDVAQNWTLDYWQNNTPGGTQSAYHNSTSEEPSVDNWLVTSQISITSDGFHHLSFWSFLGNSWSYKKNSVLVSTGSPDPADGDYVEKWAGISNDGWMWAHYFIDLEEYVGQEIYIAFRYEGDTWGHTWYVDDVALVDDSPLINLSTLEISQALGINGMGSKSFMISNQGILDLTYDVEVEYLNSDGWLTVDPISGSVSSQWQDTVSINFDAAGLAPGTYQANLNIASNDPVNPMATLLVTMDVVDVNVYPYVESFESENFPPIGWSNFNTDGDETEWALSWFNTTPGGQYSAYHGFGWTLQDGWLVAPQITVPEEGFFYLSFWSMVGDAAYYAKNSVLISTGSGNPIDGDFVEVWTVEEVTETWVQHFINIEAFAGQDIYIAFRYEGEYAHYWVIDDIELGLEVDDSPVFNVSTLAINQTVGFNGSGNKSFKVINDGILDLTFDIETEYLDGEGWLSVDPMNGSIGTFSSLDISLAFDAAGLELGIYQANLNITSNDPLNPETTVVVTIDVREAQAVNFTIIYPEYTFPTAISSDGMYVTGSQFGGLNSYLWTLFGSTVDFSGEAQDVTDNGLVVGTYNTEFDFEGMDVSTAGFWKKESQQWEFLGMNPEVPEFFGSYYNSAYGATHDFETVVGMQWYADWTVRAFKWTEEEGYQALEPSVEYNTRANGISGDGSVIYGWAEPNWTRTPVIWFNDEMIFIDNAQYGESFGASASGNFVTGAIGMGGFLWSPAEGVTLFENTLNLGSISPMVVLEDGTIFGYTAEGFPPSPDLRRAFVRHPDGFMQTFNEYVESRGWFEASDWIFFSINDVTPDGNVFIGAAELPSGEWISFVLNLNPGKPTIQVFPMQLSETLEIEGSSTQNITVSNVGTGMLSFNALVQYTASEPKYRYSPQGEPYFSGDLMLGKKGTGVAGNLNKNETNKNLMLHYDGDNFDAIGLIDGGTFYTAIRFPTDMIAPFENYTLQSVEAFINDIPTSLKLLVWDAGTTTVPGQIIYDQVFEPAGNSWNTIVLDSPVEISGADLWIGFEITNEAGTFILGIDGGPTVIEGNWLSSDGANWEHLSDYGLEGNWNIRAGLDFNGMNWLTMDGNHGIIEESNASDMTLSFDASGLESGTYTANIRISSNDVDNPLVIIPVDLEIEPDNTSVEDPAFAGISIYPNPARNTVYIAALEKMIRFEVINMLGQTFYSKEVNDQKAEFNVAGMENGMYMIRVFYPKGISTHRMQVTGQ
ncbi:MAG: choice-of-anchor J domain-containing protein [Bacteroides sp.]|nr:choice-of-anchor J domain-containing protein [Bacteroides sp.]